ncbi:MAG TPA: YdcF family protein [Pseudonocardiaceae bacterium]|nr:YdcF family protein [Pseudonocardiaceae bacterium]
MSEVGIYCFAIAAVWLLIFLVSFAVDRRKLRLGFYLLMALIFIGFGLVILLASVSRDAANLLAVGLILLLLPLFILALSVFLIGNGITMLRREGRRPANLLSLLTGLALIGVIVFDIVTAQLRLLPLEIIGGTITGISGYVAFLFTCYLLYSIVYGRIRPRRAVDFVVVLGSGLLGGTRVPPLLASRLDRGRTAFDAAIATGRDAMLITSGGQGPGEAVPESQAMADYLIDQGVPRDRILLEDKSHTTEENLAFSREIMITRLPKYRCVVVTNNFHALRAALVAKKAKVNGQVIGSRTASYFWPSATIREFAAVFLDHWIINGGICALILLAEIFALIR